MSGIYKVRFKKGDFEFELETSERGCMADILSQIRPIFPASACLDAHSPASQKAISDKEHKAPPVKKRVKSLMVEVSNICAAVKASTDIGKINENIVTQQTQLGKLLLAFKFAHECGYTSIGTGDAARILEKLKIPVSSSNAAKVIKKNPDLFSTRKEVKQGSPTPYILTPEGKRMYAKILKGNKKR